MKKVLVSILAALMLISCFAVTSYAADDTDVQFSIKGAEGKPGDKVTVEVYLDKTPGIWCAKFEVHFEQAYFRLLSVENGDVFSDAEFSKSKLTYPGYYVYYAEGKDAKLNNNNTGLILTLELEILDSAVNGDSEVSLVFPDNGFGWFFDAVDMSIDYTVSATNKASITVSGSEATSDPNGTTASDGTTAAGNNSTQGSSSGATNYVTDDKGAPVTDKSGNYETYQVPAGEPIIGYETDDNGDFVTDDKGNFETYIIDENTTSPDEETTGTGADADADDTAAPAKSSTVKKLVIVACIVAIVAAAVILIVVLTSKKNGGNDDVPPAAPVTPAEPKPEIPEQSDEAKPEEEKPEDTDNKEE